MARSHQNEVAIAGADQLEAPQDERAQQDLAQFRVLRHQRPQPVSAQFQKLARLGHASAHQTALPGDHGHFAGEFAWAMRYQQPLAVQGRLHDFHLP